MFKKKALFITFEGIEGSGKSYQSRKLFLNLKKRKISAITTREPGGSKSAELIRKIILNGEKKKFTETTDTLLYLAARNEHIAKTIKPSLLKKKIIICDRFIDSTFAYQVYGKGVNKKLVDSVHKEILQDIKPDITFVLKVNINKSFLRINKRKVKNRYDKLTKSFYIKAQNAFIKMARKNKKRYYLLDNTKDTQVTEKKILKKFLKVFEK